MLSRLNPFAGGTPVSSPIPPAGVASASDPAAAPPPAGGAVAARANGSAEQRPRRTFWSPTESACDKLGQTALVAASSTIVCGAVGVADALISGAAGGAIYNAVVKDKAFSGDDYEATLTASAGAVAGLISGPVMPVAGTALFAVIAGFTRFKERNSNENTFPSIKKVLGFGALAAVANTALLAAGFALGSKTHNLSSGFSNMQNLISVTEGTFIVAAAAGLLAALGTGIVGTAHDALTRRNPEPSLV
jgi:hypothetical protein